LLREAGYTVREGRLQSPDGRPVAVEILLADRAEERIALFYAENLRRLGFSATVRTVDLAQYHKRLALFDFDVAVALLGQSEAPGVEQRYFWSSAEASAHGGINLAGVRDAAVDALIERVVAASDMDALVAGARALDRALAWGYYCVPLGHANVDRVAYWDRLGRPERQPRYGVDLTTWWLDPAKDAALRDAAGR
jgi:microcin C transport system substrate-binding protein